jgi:hypothetical protein
MRPKEPMNQRLLTIVICLWALCPPAPGAVGAENRSSPPLAVEGVLDLTGWPLARRGPLALAGQWEFYWQALHMPQDFLLPSPPQLSGWLTMPSVWNGAVVDGRRLGGQGCATFRLRLRPDPQAGPQALLVPYAFTAYRLWVDDRLAAEAGHVGPSAAAMEPGYQARVVMLPSGKGREIALTLQVSNFMHAKGGLRAPIRLATVPQAHAVKRRALAMDVLVLGCLLIMSIYHLALFILRPVDRSHLYFALCCLLFGLRAGLTGEVFLLDLFPRIPWPLTVRLEWLGVYTGAPLAVAFVRSLYPEECPAVLPRGALAIGIVLGLVTLLGPSLLFTGLFPFMTPVIGLMLGICLWVLIRAARRRRAGAGVIMASLALVIDTVATDIL